MGELRESMRRELRLRNYSYRTIKAYLQHLTGFTRYFRKSPAEMGNKEIMQYLVHLSEDRNISASYRNQAISALKFFYKRVLNRKIEIDGTGYLQRGAWGHLLNEHHLFAIDDYLYPGPTRARTANPYTALDATSDETPRLYDYFHGKRPAARER